MEIFMDLLLNLIAEGLGIVVTVFFVDKLLQRRERQRWLPVKQAAAVQLLDVTTEIIITLTPKSIFDVKFLDVDLYKFGANYRNVFVSKEQLLDILLKSRNVIEKAMAGTQNIDSRTIDILSSCEKKLTNIIEQSSFVFDPDVMEYSVSLRQALQDLYPSNLERAISTPLYNPDVASISLFQILAIAIALRLSLIKLSDKIVPAQELSLDLETTFKDIYAKK